MLKKVIVGAVVAVLTGVISIYAVFADTGNEKYIHVSFDDVYSCLYDISTNNYNSPFENSFLGDLKSMHEKYGATFTLNCFNTYTGKPEYDISNLPSTYADEFSENSDWLKFSFHAENDNSNYGTGKNGTSTGGNPTGDCVEDVKTSYNKFISAILKATGTDKAIDTVVRLGFFGGTKNNIMALQSCKYGITGLLSADDTRVSYYLTENENQSLLSNNEYYDAENKIKMIKTQTRLENVKHTSDALNSFESYNETIIEIFTHELNYDSTVKAKLEEYLAWAKNKGYGFDFAQNLVDKRIRIINESVTQNSVEYIINISDGKQGVLISALYDRDGTLKEIKSAQSQKIQTMKFDLKNGEDTGMVKFFSLEFFIRHETAGKCCFKSLEI